MMVGIFHPGSLCQADIVWKIPQEMVVSFLKTSLEKRKKKMLIGIIIINYLIIFDYKVSADVWSASQLIVIVKFC